MFSPVFVSSSRGVAALTSFAAALWAFASVEPSRAQDIETLPAIDVVTSRLNVGRATGRSGTTPRRDAPVSQQSTTGESTASPGIAGASTTVITAADIARAPESSLQDIISREAGIQTSALYGAVNGTGSTVDLRGFGVTAPSNVLVLVDGRRYNDNDIPGFDFSLIPRNSVERIEITRGNSGGVLYGDGAVGGVINIVTKSGVGAKPNVRVEGAIGSFRTREGNVSASASHNGLAAAMFGNFFESDGYRVHNKTRQTQGVFDLRYRTDQGSVFVNVTGDNLRQDLPGPRNISNGFSGVYNEYETDRRGTNTPFDYAERHNVTLRGGVTRNLWNGVELVLDGSIRQKDTESAFFNPFNNPFVVPGSPSAYLETNLRTLSVTPRVNLDQTFGNVRVRGIAGVDVYDTRYRSDRSFFKGASPIHIYSIDQITTAGYFQPTLTFFGNTDVSFGGRVQRNSLSARDSYDPTAPAPLFVNPQGLPLDRDETRHATHIGIEHRFNPHFAIFGRMAQSFRVPNVDERIGASPAGVVTNFDLRTQRSHDYEAGFRVHAGPFDLQTSYYRMVLVDEIHFNPITFANTNLDPTLRYGVENSASYRFADNLRMKGSVTYTRAKFREGPFAGNDVPEVARWSAAAGVSWDIYKKYLTLDGVVRYVGKRYMDGDEANTGAMMVPSHTVVDLRLGGEYGNLFWAINVQNLFDRLYFDYGLDGSFPGSQFFSLYPLPGRTIQFRLGARFG